MQNSGLATQDVMTTYGSKHFDEFASKLQMSQGLKMSAAIVYHDTVKAASDMKVDEYRAHLKNLTDSGKGDIVKDHLELLVNAGYLGLVDPKGGFSESNIDWAGNKLGEMAKEMSLNTMSPTLNAILGKAGGAQALVDKYKSDPQSLSAEEIKELKDKGGISAIGDHGELTFDMKGLENIASKQRAQNSMSGIGLDAIGDLGEIIKKAEETMEKQQAAADKMLNTQTFGDLKQALTDGSKQITGAINTLNELLKGVLQ